MDENLGFEEQDDGTTIYDILGEEFEITSQQATYLKWTNRHHEKCEQGEKQGKQVYRQLGTLNAYKGQWVRIDTFSVLLFQLSFAGQ